MRIREVVAAVADLGTVLPIIVALSVTTGLPVTRACIVLGIALIFTGLRYRLPIAVQPLKAVAAIVITNDLPASVLPLVAAAMATIMLIASATPIPRWLSKLPSAFIRGNQLAVGALLIVAAARLIGLAGPAPAGSVSRSIPSIVLVLLISQVPVTVSNAVAGTASLARDAYGMHAGHVSERALLRSTAAMNVLAAAAGGIPMCHGSSGLTAYRLWGARTAIPTITLGATLCAAAAFAGDALTTWIAMIPAGVLAALIGVTGARHAALVIDQRGSDLAIASTIGLSGIATRSLTIGLLAGIMLLSARMLARRVTTRRAIEAM